MSSKDLTEEVKNVWSARSLADKKAAMENLISVAHARKETKALALVRLAALKSTNQVDKFAVNFMMSGEGMKV